MALGPISYMIVTFEGNHFKGEILDALLDAVEKDMIRVVDILFAKKNPDSSIEIAELHEVKQEISASEIVAAEMVELLSDADLVEIARELAPNTAAGVLVIEHLWAIPLGNAIANAGGTITESGMVKREIVEAAEAYITNLIESGE